MTPQDKSCIPHVIIVGGGLGGICCAIALKTQLDFHNFTIYEKASDFGGTWRDNTYPGSACDTPTHWYSLSTESNPNWSAVMAPQPEILAYWQGLATKYDLHVHTIFETKVVSAEWDPLRQQYDILAVDVHTGEQSRSSARGVVSTVGILSEPFVPVIKGMAVFKGSLFHSARWDHSVDFHNKRVAVVGNGASAAQFIPPLVADPTTRITHFCRTPNWFVYGPRATYPALLRWTLAHVPLALRMWRIWVFMARLSRPYVQSFLRRLTGRKAGVEDLVEYIRRNAPERYHSQLIPTYPLPCRRPILDPGYLSCLHSPNIELNWDNISEITEDGIRAENGHMHPFDVIILGTGFVTGGNSISVTGSKGQTLEEYHAKQGGASAYLGVVVPDFPNFFLIGGPNTVTANGSAVYTHEIEINYIVQLITPLLRNPVSAASISVRSSAHASYNTELQAAMSTAAYTGCPPSWFRVGGKNISVFPWSHWWFWWLLRKVHWEDYIVRGI